MNPNRFDRTNDTNWLRLAATTVGCTVADTAASNADAAARACPAAPCAWAPAADSHPTYGEATPAIATAAGPCHAAPANPDVTDPKEPAAEPNSPASPSQAAAASKIGPGPAPKYTRAELISGGNTKKLTTHVL